MRPIVAIRPQPGLAATMQCAQDMGLEVIGEPLFQVVPRVWTLPDIGQCDALLTGSANVFRHGGPQLEKLRHLPVHAVGKTTASAARAAGFQVEMVGEGGLQTVLDMASGRAAYLRLAGAEHVALVPPRNVSIVTQEVYGVDALPVSPGMAAMLRQGALVLLHSAAAARHFAAECDADGIARHAIALATLGPRISQSAGQGWARCVSAPQPNDPALLALAREMR